MVSESDETLALHNYSRARHGVSPLMWDYAASVWATSWANQCIWGHNSSDPYISNIAMTYPDWKSVYKTWCARPPAARAALSLSATRCAGSEAHACALPSSPLPSQVRRRGGPLRLDRSHVRVSVARAAGGGRRRGGRAAH